MWGAYAFGDGEDEDFDISNFDRFGSRGPGRRSKVAVGLTADITWNVLGGADDRNFGMAGVGLSLSY
jgi:hypothetical protein